MNQQNPKDKPSFAEVRLSKKSFDYDRPAIVIQTLKGKVYINNHADPDLLRAVLSSL
ncbi:hypothetical protein AAK706_13135 [Erysipelotrichaceae bacterium 66-17]|nr:hypothetical protein EROP_12820 [Erysipelotrichaceae bacterium OPF54]